MPRRYELNLTKKRLSNESLSNIYKILFIKKVSNYRASILSEYIFAIAIIHFEYWSNLGKKLEINVIYRYSKHDKTSKTIRDSIKFTQKSKIFLQINKTFIPLQSQIKKGSQIEIWCNGSTTDSGSVSEGSSPSISTRP